nr:unnamed protein product [Callosobruchus analis]
MQEGREGGMWLGFRTKETEGGKNKVHCLAVLLNIAGEALEHSHGRGVIVKNYLLSSQKPPDYIKELEKNHNFSGYTFVAVELSQNEAITYHHGNRPLVDSIYTGEHTLGFGNSPPYSPYSKVCKGRYRMLEILESGKRGDELVQELLNLLKDRTKHLPDEELQRRSPAAYECLSSVYVDMSEHGYGTRTHTVITIDSDWNMEFIEHTMKAPIDPKNPEWDVTKIKARL